MIDFPLYFGFTKSVTLVIHETILKLLKIRLRYVNDIFSLNWYIIRRTAIKLRPRDWKVLNWANIVQHTCTFPSNIIYTRFFILKKQVFKRLHLGTVSFGTDSMDEVCTLYIILSAEIFLVTFREFQLECGIVFSTLAMAIEKTS